MPGFRVSFPLSYMIAVCATMSFFALEVLFIYHHQAQMTSGECSILLFSVI